MKTLDQAYREADKGPVVVDNHLMLATTRGVYLAQVDASEGRKWRASAALLAHGFNNMPGMMKALKAALEVVRDCDMPKTYHRTKADVVAEIEAALEKADQVKEIGE